MNIRNLALRASAVGVGAALILSQLGVMPAAAQTSIFVQTWNTTDSYRASYDFIPNTTYIGLGNKSCTGGTGEMARTDLVRTSGSTTVAYGPEQYIDGVWHDTGNNYVRVSSTTSYYLRYYSLVWKDTAAGGWTHGGYTLCQGVAANRN